MNNGKETLCKPQHAHLVMITFNQIWSLSVNLEPNEELKGNEQRPVTIQRATKGNHNQYWKRDGDVFLFEPDPR